MGEKHLTPPIDLTCSNIDGKRKEREGAAFAQCGGSYCKKTRKEYSYICFTSKPKYTCFKKPVGKIAG